MRCLKHALYATARPRPAPVPGSGRKRQTISPLDVYISSWIILSLPLRLAHHVVRKLMPEAALAREHAPEALSFKHSLTLMRRNPRQPPPAKIPMPTSDSVLGSGTAEGRAHRRQCDTAPNQATAQSACHRRSWNGLRPISQPKATYYRLYKGPTMAVWKTAQVLVCRTSEAVCGKTACTV